MDTSHPCQPSKEQLSLAQWLATIAASPLNPGYLPQHFVPQPKSGVKLGNRDYQMAAELATNHFVVGACIMYLPQTSAFYFQPIIAALPIAPIRGPIG